MDKLTRVKYTTVVKYLDFLKKIQKGYPIEKYCYIKEACMKLKFLKENEIDDEERITVLNDIQYKYLMG